MDAAARRVRRGHQHRRAARRSRSCNAAAATAAKRWSITQSVADVEALTNTPRLLDSLTDNFAGIVAHEQSSPDSRDWLARLMGTRELWQSTNQTDGHGLRLSGRGSSRRVREFVVPPDMFRTLRTGEAVIYTSEGLPSQRAVDHAADPGAARAAADQPRARPVSYPRSVGLAPADSPERPVSEVPAGGAEPKDGSVEIERDDDPGGRGRVKREVLRRPNVRAPHRAMAVKRAARNTRALTPDRRQATQTT